jgi:hypothetical protein
MRCLHIDAYNQHMMKARDDEQNAADDDRPGVEETSRSESDNDKSNADDTDADETKRFERSDNLRRRSEWFQKRTGGG